MPSKTLEDNIAVGLELLKIQEPRLFHAIYIHRTHQNHVLDFTNNPWQVKFLIDDSPIKVCKKSSQCGITLLDILELFLLAKDGYSGLYVLPTDTWKNTFVPNRIDKTIEVVPEYRENCLVKRKDADSRTMKTLYGQNWKFVGSQQRNNFYEFPADAIFIDEYDQCDQENLNYAFDRLGASSNPTVRKFGNPTIAGVGIDAEFDMSDGKEWFLTCESCNESQPLDWFVNFIRQEDDGSFTLINPNGVCRKCNRQLNRNGKGEWVASRNSDISGYHINKMFADNRGTINGLHPMEYLFGVFLEAQTNPSKLQRFYNNDLGIAYNAPGSNITESMIAECVDSYNVDTLTGDAIAGVDVGSVLHVHISRVIDGVRKKVFVGTCRDFEHLAFLCHKYKVQLGVIDAMPETHKVKEFIRDHSGWYKCEYHKSDRADDFKVDYVSCTVKIDRTQSLDASYQAWMDRRVMVTPNWRSMDNGDFVKQMLAPVRVYDEDKNRYVWDEGAKDDHHRHADNYENIAKRLYGGGGSVLTVL